MTERNRDARVGARRAPRDSATKGGRFSHKQQAGRFGSEQAGAFAEYARWLADWHWRRGDSYERRAGQILAFDGVLLGLIVAAAPKFNQVKSDWSRVTLRAVAVAAVVSLLVAAASFVQSLLRRQVHGVPLAHVEERWRSYRRSGALTGHVITSSVDELLLPGADAGPEEQSVLADLAEDARLRGAAFFRGAPFTLVGLVFLAAAGILIILTS